MLIAVVALSAFIRVPGVWFGYPLAVHPDEGRLVNPALKMVRTGDLNPHFFNYPSLNIYLQAALFKAAEVFKIGARDTGGGGDPNISFYVLGRLLTVGMSLATIVVTFLIGRRLIGPAAGVAAATFVGASSLHVLNSFTITVDTPMALWSTLTLLMAARIATGNRGLIDYILAGLFAGLAVGSKYTAVLCVVPILLGHFFGWDGPGSRAGRRLLIALAIVPVAFLVTTPFALLDFPAFRDAIASESRHYRGGHFGFEAAGSTSIFLYATALVEEGLGPVGAGFALVGLGWFAGGRVRHALLLASFPLFLVFFVGQYKVFFARNVVAAVPGLAVLSGAGVSVLLASLDSAWRSRGPVLPPARILAGASAALLFLVGIWQQVGLARESIRVLTLPDSRWIGLQWIDANIPAGTVICRERYTPPVQNLGRQYQVTNLGFFALTKANARAKIDGCDYVILSSFNFDRFFIDRDQYPEESEAYESFFSTRRLVHEFKPDNVGVGGPRVLIFAIDGHVDVGSELPK
jgi:4-amino-4-deoxy-L-arabinose transferase-like glycosyltransferase